MKYLFTILVLALSIFGNAQNFNYEVTLTPVAINELPGIQSYAFAQYEGKWLIVGGRVDGLHPRQPHSSFSATYNNKSMYVIDPVAKKYWSTPLTSLSTSLQEQLQSTNMNFHQMEDTLYIIGGYGFSTTANDHITYDNLTTIGVSAVIDAIINTKAIAPHIKQISHERFAVTGGQMGAINSTLYLVGGHRFDGRYNPMGHNTYVQTYSEQVKKFNIDNSGNSIVITGFDSVLDAVHLHRRDYNLLPQIFPNGDEGFTISSGVFQKTANLPYLYPVDITATKITPQTSFNQYLSNYHGAKACLYDAKNKSMHNLFFGGLGQYQYVNGNLVKDDQVPFVKTISLLSRDGNGKLKETKLGNEMPSLQGASAEFIPNHHLAHFASDIIKMNSFSSDTVLIGHIFGGIHSTMANAFFGNNGGATKADNTIYEVRLILNKNVNAKEIQAENPYSLEVYPNKVSNSFQLEFDYNKSANVDYFLTNVKGQMVQEGRFKLSGSSKTIELNQDIAPQVLFLTVVVDNLYFFHNKLIKE